MKFIKELFSWFFKGHTKQANDPPPEEELLLDNILQSKEPLSDKIVDDIWKQYSPDTIIGEMRKLGIKSHSFDEARQELMRELKKLDPDYPKKA